MTPTPPLLSGNAKGFGDYFITISPPPREADAEDHTFFNMKEATGSKAGTPVASEKDARPKKTDDNDADLLFKLDMDD